MTANRQSCLKNLCFPLAIGNPVIRHNRPTITDGKVSSIVLVASLIPIFFVIIIVLSIEPSIRKPNPFSWGLTELMFAAGSFFSIFLSMAAYRNRTKWLAGLRVPELSHKPRLLFLWIFGFGVIIYAALNMSVNIDCIIKGGRQPFPGEQIISVFSHIMEITFFVTQLGFIAYFVNYRFVSSVLLSYGISTMLITHLVVWFHSVVSSLFRNHVLNSNFTMLNETGLLLGIRH